MNPVGAESRFVKSVLTQDRYYLEDSTKFVDFLLVVMFFRSSCGGIVLFIAHSSAFHFSCCQ